MSENVIIHQFCSLLPYSENSLIREANKVAAVWTKADPQHFDVNKKFLKAVLGTSHQK
jgi:hypothetical protein